MTTASNEEHLSSFQMAVSLNNITQAVSLLSKITLPNSRTSQVPAFVGILAMVVQRGQHEMLSALLTSKPELAQSMFWFQAIDYAASNRDTASLQCFIDAGWDVNEGVGESTQRPILTTAVTQHNPLLRRWLLERGASPNVEDRWSVTSMEWAAQRLGVAELEEFIRYGGNPATDDSLHFAAMKGRLSNAQFLLQKGAKISKPEKDGVITPEPKRRGRTPLRIAVDERQPQMVQLLLARGARPDEIDQNGMTVLESAAQTTRAFRDDTIERILKDWHARTGSDA